MSAIALIQTPDETHLYSDGFAISCEGVEHEGHKKINKINEYTAMIDVGRWYEGNVKEIVEQVKRMGLTDPEEIANQAADMMKVLLDGMNYESDSQPDGKATTYCMVLGYRNGFPVCFIVDAQNDFQPEQIPVTTDLFVTSMIYGNWGEEKSSYPKHLRQALGEYTDLATAGHKAFYKYLEEYKHTGRVNMDIYYERITNEQVKV